MSSTLHSAGGHHHGAVDGGPSVFVLLHGLWDQLATVLFHMRRQLPTHVAGDRAHAVDCSDTASELNSFWAHRQLRHHVTPTLRHPGHLETG